MIINLSIFAIRKELILDIKNNKIKGAYGMNKNQDGYIYFIGNQSKTSIKIGFTRSKDINKRLKQLSTGNSEDLEILYSIQCDIYKEKLLHSQFSDYRLHGEWFKYEPVMKWIEYEKLQKDVLKQLGYIK